MNQTVRERVTKLCFVGKKKTKKTKLFYSLDCKKYKRNVGNKVSGLRMQTSCQVGVKRDYGRGGGPKHSYRRQDQGNKRRALLKSCYKNQKQTHRDEKQSSN